MAADRFHKTLTINMFQHPFPGSCQNDLRLHGRRQPFRIASPSKKVSFFASFSQQCVIRLNANHDFPSYPDSWIPPAPYKRLVRFSGFRPFRFKESYYEQGNSGKGRRTAMFFWKERYWDQSDLIPRSFPKASLLVHKEWIQKGAMDRSMD